MSNTSPADQERFQEIGRLIGELFVGAIKHAAGAAPDAAEFLVQRYRADRGSVRAVVGMEAPGAVSFEWRDDRGEWRSAITLRGEGPPDLRLN